MFPGKTFLHKETPLSNPLFSYEEGNKTVPSVPLASIERVLRTAAVLFIWREGVPKVALPLPETRSPSAEVIGKEGRGKKKKS